MVYFEVFALV